MKKTSTQTTLKNSQNKLLFKLDTTTWLLVVGLVLFNVGCFLPLSNLENLIICFFNLIDFRTWAWWYFVCLGAVVAFSIHWFLIYQNYTNNNLDPKKIEEYKWFCILSGTIVFIIAVFVFLHRFSILNLFDSL
jgi:Na+/H+ antiporter NhaD/arsenite permease-like protein